MNANLTCRGKGFVLMDAMIAIVVIGIGLFGIVRLNSVMLAGTAIGKTRAEATQLAEGKLEEIRAQQPPATKPVSSTSPETITGVNATFSRSWTFWYSVSPVALTWTGYRYACPGAIPVAVPGNARLNSTVCYPGPT